MVVLLLVFSIVYFVFEPPWQGVIIAKLDSKIETIS